MLSEHSIQSAIMVAVSRHRCTVFRANVGKAKTADGRNYEELYAREASGDDLSKDN